MFHLMVFPGTFGYCHSIRSFIVIFPCFTSWYFLVQWVLHSTWPYILIFTCWYFPVHWILTHQLAPYRYIFPVTLGITTPAHTISLYFPDSPTGSPGHWALPPQMATYSYIPLIHLLVFPGTFFITTPVGPVSLHGLFTHHVAWSATVISNQKPTKIQPQNTSIQHLVSHHKT